jgi:cell division protein FtsB
LSAKAIEARVAKVKKSVVCVEREAKDCRRKLQEREAPAIADIQQVVGLFGSQLHPVFEEDGPPVLAGAEMLRAKEQLKTEFGGLNQRVGMLEQGIRLLSDANEAVQRHIGAAVAEGSGKAKQDSTDLERELAKLKERMRQFEGLKAAAGGQPRLDAQEICDVKHDVDLPW